MGTDVGNVHTEVGATSDSLAISDSHNSWVWTFLTIHIPTLYVFSMNTRLS